MNTLAPELDIVIPVYQEGASIVRVLESLRTSVTTSFRVLLCYDDDEDDTLLAVAAYRPEGFELVLVKNAGVGALGAVVTGLAATKAPAVLISPADDEDNATRIDALMQAFRAGCDVVCASRFAPGARVVGYPWSKMVLVRTAGFVLHHLAGLPTQDPSNGLRLFSRRVIDSMPIETTKGHAYSIELLVKAHRLGWRIGEVPVDWRERKQGKSRFHLVRWLPSYAVWFGYALATACRRRLGLPASRPRVPSAAAPRRSGPRHRGTTALAGLTVACVLVIFGFLCWRATLPNNHHRNLDIYGTREGGAKTIRSTDGFDDAATVATAYHFARDGFLRTHFLPNRGRAPQVSLFDYTQTQCETGSPSAHYLRYASPWGPWLDMVSLTDDCIYAHYPPLSDWFFGVLASVGMDDVVQYKLAALLLNGAFLVAVFLWLRREVCEPAAWITLLLTATLPAFLQWADVLFFHPFQYLFLFAGFLSWTSYLRRPRPGPFLATWCLFFAEALVSYDLILFFALALFGLAHLEWAKRGWRAYAKPLAGLATAPLAATCLHFGLRVMHFGLQATLFNAQATLRSRVLDGLTWSSIPRFLRYINTWLVRLDVFALALLLLILVRWWLRAELRRTALLLFLLFVGGMSYTLAFPGTSLWQPWMKYRHFMPLTIAAIAFLADSLFLAWNDLARDAPRARRTPFFRMMRVASIAGSLLLLAGMLWRNVKTLRGEIAWHVSRNQHRDPTNLAVRFLDVLHWFESPIIRGDDRLHMPVDGRRVNDPAFPGTRFAVHTGTISHYEIWWLEDERMKTIRILTDRADALSLLEDCRLSFFDGQLFHEASPQTTAAVQPFVPDPNEPTPPGYSWVRYSLPAAIPSRALRLSFSGRVPFPLHEIEVHGDPPEP